MSAQAAIADPPPLVGNPARQTEPYVAGYRARNNGWSLESAERFERGLLWNDDFGNDWFDEFRAGWAQAERELFERVTGRKPPAPARRRQVYEEGET